MTADRIAATTVEWLPADRPGQLAGLVAALFAPAALADDAQDAA